MNEKSMWLINTTPYGIGENCVFLSFLSKFRIVSVPPPSLAHTFAPDHATSYIKKDNSNTEAVTRRCKQKKEPGIAQLS